MWREPGARRFNPNAAMTWNGVPIVHGKIVFEGRSTDELRENEQVKPYYLGALRRVAP